MAGTRAGGLKAAETNRKRYGDGSDGKDSFYTQIGRKGGKVSRGGGFARDHDFAVAMAHKSVELRWAKKEAVSPKEQPFGRIVEADR